MSSNTTWKSDMIGPGRMGANSVPARLLSAALYERFSSRGEGNFADMVLSALSYQFGGHEEKAPAQEEAA
jgi:hypothetical protein